jgi:multicomponent Na+:H+ antiporter subunit D
MESLIPLYVILPLGAAFLIPILGRVIKEFQKTISLLVFFVLLCLSIYFIVSGIHEPLIYKIGGWEPVKNIPIGIYLVLDGLSVFMLCIINLIAFLSGFYSISYISRYTAENNYYALFSLMVAGMNGVILTGDLFNLFVFIEIAVIASYALVAFGIEKEELEASFKYQVLGCMASILILFSIGLLYWNTKTLNIADISTIVKTGIYNKVLIFSQLVLLTGFGLKAAIIPFHAWLPDAHSSAPSPISAMLSGVLIKSVGIYAIIRLFFNMFSISYEVALTLTILGVLSMIVGSLLAIGQWDVKRLLAYSSISQVGYIIMGVGIGLMIITKNGNRTIAALSIFGGLFHLVNHAVFKGLLFLSAGAVEYRTGTRNLKELGGLSGKMPITSSSSLIASLAISGIPPFNGFFSKLVIIIAAIQAHFYWLAFIAIIVSIITLAYFLKLQKNTFYGKSVNNKLENIKEAPFTMCFSMIILAILCIALSLLVIPAIREAVMDPVVNALIEKSNYLLILSDI